VKPCLNPLTFDKKYYIIAIIHYSERIPYMKFIHISDLHLGRKISNVSLCSLQHEMLDFILRYIDENKIDSLLIAGDIYDKPIPSIEAVNLFDYFLTQLSQKNIPVFIISGNHDSPERLRFAGSILEKNNIHIDKAPDKTLQKFTVSDEYGNINIYMLPYVKLPVLSTLFPECKFISISDAIEKLIDNTPINPEERNILLYHGFVLSNKTAPETSDSEIQLGGMQIVNADIFSDFDYTALGHIHKPQKIKDNLYYSGSLLKYSFSESNQKKSFLVIDMKQKGDIKINTVPLIPSQDMRRIKGNFSDIMENSEKSDDFIRAELEDSEKIPFAMEQLRENLFCNITELVYSNELKRLSAAVTEASSAENRSDMELITEFFRNVYNEELTPEKINILKEICMETERKSDYEAY